MWRGVIGWPSLISRRRWLGYDRRWLVGGLFNGMSSLSSHLAFFRRGRVVLGQQFEVDTAGDADRLQFFGRSTGGISVFTNDAGEEEAFGVLEITDQFDGAVAWSDHMQIYSDLSGLIVPLGIER